MAIMFVNKFIDHEGIRRIYRGNEALLVKMPVNQGFTLYSTLWWVSEE